jgi:acetylornithine deacetylase/succinyl-diaminopimelate desuccinylase-like protein
MTEESDSPLTVIPSEARNLMPPAFASHSGPVVAGSSGVRISLIAQVVFVAALALFLVAVPARGQSQPRVDWNKLDAEALDYFRAYLRFDTSNPPGNTSAAIAFLQDILRKEGIDTQTFESKPGMVNLVARLPGPSGVKPLLLMSHADVVPAIASNWSHPPFAADLDDGYVWARGAIDNKAHGIMALMTMLALKRQGVQLRRGVEMMVNADEEAGGENGATFMVDKHFDAIDPEYAVNEGGEGTLGWLGTSGVTFRIAVSEKRVMWLRLTAHGKSGHGSMPNADNPNLILIDALARLLANQPAVRITPVFDRAMKTMAPQMAFPASFELAHLDLPLMADLAMRGRLRQYQVQALMRDTIVPTMLGSGVKVNVIPSTAEAALDCRLLPGTDVDAFLARMRKLLADPRITYDFIQKPDRSPSSPADGEAWNAIEKIVARDFPGALVVPSMTAGGTDSRMLRMRGVPAYGFVPIVLDEKESARVHGVDERLSVENLDRGIGATYDLVMELCGPRP